MQWTTIKMITIQSQWVANNSVKTKHKQVPTKMWRTMYVFSPGDSLQQVDSFRNVWSGKHKSGDIDLMVITMQMLLDDNLTFHHQIISRSLKSKCQLDPLPSRDKFDPF